MSLPPISPTGSTADVANLSPFNPITNNPGKPGSPPPALGQKQVKQKSGEIQYDWAMSVDKLNEELRALRDATAKLLAEITKLIDEDETRTQLKPLAEALLPATTSVSRAFADMTHVEHAINQLQSAPLPKDIAEKVDQYINEFRSSIRKVQPAPDNGSGKLLNVPKSDSKNNKDKSTESTNNSHDESSLVSPTSDRKRKKISESGSGTGSRSKYGSRLTEADKTETGSNALADSSGHESTEVSYESEVKPKNKSKEKSGKNSDSIEKFRLKGTKDKEEESSIISLDSGEGDDDV